MGNAGNKIKLPKPQYHRVELVLQGKNLEPDWITEYLQVEPDICYRRGPDWIGSKEKYLRGYWSVCSNLKAVTLTRHAKNIIKRIEQCIDKLKKVVEHKEVENAYLDITLELTSYSLLTLYLPPEIIQIASLGFDLEFSLWIPGTH